MCGRYTIATADDLLLQLGLAGALDKWRGTYNAAPGQDLPCVLNREGEERVRLMRWGLLPAWTKETTSKWINARAEGLAERPAFRDAYAKRRCLVPANGFYEWRRVAGTRSKTPFYFCRADGLALAFAGIWERRRKDDGDWLYSFAIATTSADEPVAGVHDRMPVIVAPEDYPRWLCPDVLEPAALDDIVRGSGAQALEGFEVSKQVNSVANDGPELIAPDSRQLGLF